MVVKEEQKFRHLLKNARSQVTDWRVRNPMHCGESTEMSWCISGAGIVTLIKASRIPMILTGMADVRETMTLPEVADVRETMTLTDVEDMTGTDLGNFPASRKMSVINGADATKMNLVDLASLSRG
jgi:hypothetical protein